MVKSIWHGILNGSFLGLYQDTNTVFRTVCSLELSIYQCLCIMWKLLIPCWDSIVNETIWKNCMVTIWQNVSPSSKNTFHAISSMVLTFQSASSWIPVSCCFLLFFVELKVFCFVAWSALTLTFLSCPFPNTVLSQSFNHFKSVLFIALSGKNKY